MLRLTCGPTPVLFVARDPRVQPAPGFPCALSLRGGWNETQSSGATRRENANSHPSPYSTVMPAKAGIQYPAASQLKHCRLWNTGSSAFADDESGGVFVN